MRPVLVVSGCGIINNFRDHYVDTTTDQLTTDMNRYMRVLMPEWKYVEMFGEHAEYGSIYKQGCGAVGTGLKPRPGPPWILSLGVSADPDESESINARVAVLKSQYGFRERSGSITPNTTSSATPAEARVHDLENDAGYLAQVFPKAPFDPVVPRLDGDRTLIRVVSPCVRYPGDE